MKLGDRVQVDGRGEGVVVGMKRGAETVAVKIGNRRRKYPVKLVRVL